MEVFECAKCCKKLRTREGIVHHLKKCQNIKLSTNKQNDPLKKLHPCAQCQREFFTRSGLFKHVKKYHSSSEQQNFSIQKEMHQKTKSLTCKYCTATFASKQGRINHAKKNHPEYVTKINERSARKLYECIYCHKSFTRKSYRARHEDICMNKKLHETFSTSNARIPVVKQETCESNNSSGTEDSNVNVNTTPWPIQCNSNHFLGTPQFNSCDNELPQSSGNIVMTPKLRRYLRDRKSFLKLRSPDINSPRKSRLNLQYGQQTIVECQKEISALRQQVRRLQKQVQTLKAHILYLEEQNDLSQSTPDTIFVGLDGNPLNF